MSFYSNVHKSLALGMLIVLLVTVGVTAAVAADLKTSGLPVALEADEFHFDEKTDTYQAAGSVHMKRGDMSLVSEELTWNASSGLVEAHGGVHLEHGADVLEGDSLRLDMESGQATLHRGRAYVKEHNFYIAGDLIKRLGEKGYRVNAGTFTTCVGEVPSWKFGARRLDVTLGGYARAKHVLFYLHDIPVFYLPYLIYPAKTERESGFLLPRYGISESKGLELSLAYYLVMARNMDATFYLDYLSEMGLGKGLEYRYIVYDDNDGIFKGYHMNGSNGFGDRYALGWEHAGTLPGSVRLTVDAEYVSDQDYYADFGEFADEYNKTSTESILGLNRQWRKSAVTGQLKYTKNLLRDNAQTLQRLPDLDFSMMRRRVGDSPLYFGLELSSTYFWRREGLKAERLSARPELSVVLRPGKWFALEAGAGYRQRHYWTSSEGPGTIDDGIYDLFATLSTGLSRVYDVSGREVRKISHSIEPELRYRYVPREDQSGLPQFDRFDTIVPENVLNFALTNRIVTKLESKTGDSYREFLYLRLSQDYDIREARRELFSPEDKRRPFGDIQLEMVLKPTRSTFLDVDATYDVHGGSRAFAERFTSFDTQLGVRNDAGNALALETRYLRDETDYLAGSLSLSWFKPFYVNYQQRYHLGEKEALETFAAVQYRAQCWNINVSYRDRLEDEEFLISFSLTGVGTVGKFGGSLNGRDTE